MTQTPTEVVEQALDQEDALTRARTLAKELGDLRLNLQTYDDYYAGDQALPTEPKRLTSAYKELLDMSTSNWCRLVVDVVAERLQVGAIVSSQDERNDAAAWAYWQANNLDAMQTRVHTEALKLGLCYVSVWPSAQPDGKPRVVGESPMQVHVATDEVTGEPTHAVKLWQGNDLRIYVSLYTHQRIYRFRTSRPEQAPDLYSPRRTLAVDLAALRLEPRPNDDDGGWLIDNPTGLIPFVPFHTQPDLLGGYASEIAGVIPLQDRINRTTFHRLLTQEFHAFPQRWVTGIDVEVDENGKPVQPFATEVDRLWVATSESTNFGQFGAADPSGFLRSIEADIQSMATQSRTPPHYLMAGMGQFPSGESVRATEYGLHRKVRDRQMTYGEAWEEVIRRCARIDNSALADDEALSVKWTEVEARTEGEIADMLLKMSTLGVPRKVLWERWGATPDEAKRWEEALQAEREAAAGLAGLPTPEEGMSYGEAGPPEARVEEP